MFAAAVKLKDAGWLSSHLPTQLFGSRFAGLPFPDVDQELAGNGAGQFPHLLVHAFNDPLITLQLAEQPGRQLRRQPFPARAPPPTVTLAVALAEQAHAALGGKTQPLAAQLVPLPAERSLLLLGLSGHLHHRQRFLTANNMDIQYDD